MKRTLTLALALLAVMFFPLPTLASGTITGTLQGHVASYGSSYYNLKGSSTNYALPESTTFEGGAINGTIYTCDYTGKATAITKATCKVKTEVVKGYYFDNTIVDVNDSSNVLANLPTSATFSGGKTNGNYYTCNYTGSLPDVSSAKCSIDTLTGAATTSGYRLFPSLSCPSGTTLTCWISRVWSFSQGAILTLSVVAIVVAGIIYMTSRGNPKQVETAKKIIFGALSAVAVIILGKFFLTKVVGVPWL